MCSGSERSNASSARSRRSAVLRARPGWNRPRVVESEDQRHNRELIELVNELRVALPGVQVLFAFLLAVPFSNGYKRITSFEKAVFFMTLIATAISTAFFTAPSAYHLLHFRNREKERLLFTSNKFA